VATAATAVVGGRLRADGVGGDASQKVDLKVSVVTTAVPLSRPSANSDDRGRTATVVDLNSATGRRLTAAFLATATKRKFQSVVLPNQAPSGLSAAELTALTTFESTFGIRQVDSYVYPTGGRRPERSSYSGQLTAPPRRSPPRAKAVGAFRT